MRSLTFYRWIITSSVVLAFVVVVLGAYVRLSAAGLSCPDWPGCYGQLSVSAALTHATQISQHFPDNPLQPDKAIKEMVHRYAAGTLGLLIVAVVLVAWRNGRNMMLPLLLVALVIFQALLGMWTVTLALKPLVVTAHLIGGMSVLALLWWLRLGIRADTRVNKSSMHLYAVAGLLLLAIQIALGGWTSSHYAGVACTGFPRCNGEWWPSADFFTAFGDQSLNGAGLVAIHWSHRLVAFAVALYLGWLVWHNRYAAQPVRQISIVLALLLVLQITIGIANVLTDLPLPLATAHNAVAALLLLTLVTLNQRLTIAGESS